MTKSDKNSQKTAQEEDSEDQEELGSDLADAEDDNEPDDFDDEMEDDEWDDDDDEWEEEEDDDETPNPPSPNRRFVKLPGPAILSISGIVLLLLGIYGANCWVNIRAGQEVRSRCGGAEEQLDRTISDLRDEALFPSEWMLKVHQARRIYLRELCNRAVVRLEWWRWNLLSPVEIHLSPQSQEDIERILVRTSSSCESEIRDHEVVFLREMELQKVSPQVQTTVKSVIEWQYTSCRELGAAVDGGFWPPLKASGPSTIPEALGAILPQPRGNTATIEPGRPEDE